MKKLFIFGSSGYFKEQFIWLKDMISSTNTSSIEILGIIDNKNKKKKDNYSGLKIYKSNKIKYSKNIYIYIAVGNPDLRGKAIKKFHQFNFFSMIHPSAVISNKAKLGVGLTISPGCIVAGNARLGDFNNLNFGSMISHDCEIKKNNTFSPGTKIMGNCMIGNNNNFGVNSVMIPGTKVENNNIIGASCTITKNFKSNLVLTGLPATINKKK